MKSILVFSHNHNTFDKKKLLENPHPDFFKESPKTVDMFIREDKERPIKDFFLNKIDDLLANYEPGEPKMKPDVLKQTKEIEEKRAKMMAEQNNTPSIMMSRDGGPPTPLSPNEIIEIINTQKDDIQKLLKQSDELQNVIVQLQNQFNIIQSEKRGQEDYIQTLKTRIEYLENELREKSLDVSNEKIEIVLNPKSKTEPEV